MRSSIKSFFHNLTNLPVYDPYDADSSTPKPYVVVKLGDETNMAYNRFADQLNFEVHVAVDLQGGGITELDASINMITNSHNSTIVGYKIERLRTTTEFFDATLSILTRSVSFRMIKLNLEV